MISAVSGPTRTRTRLPSRTSDATGARTWFTAESVGLRARDRDLPRVDGERDPALAGGRRSRTTPPPSSVTAVSPSGPGEAVPASRFAPVKLATNASAGAARRSAGAADLEHAALDEHADAVGQRGRVLEVVRDEDRRQAELAAAARAARPGRVARVCASSAESGSSRSRTRGSRASARASATRWRSPPESSSGRASASAEIRKRSSSSSTRAAAAEGDVRAHGQVREERVLLEDEPDRAALGRQVDPALGVEPRRRRRARSGRGRGAAARRPRAARSSSPPRTARRARASRARPRGLARGVGAKSVVEPELERLHAGTSLTARRTAALTTTSSAPIASAVSKSTSNCS